MDKRSWPWKKKTSDKSSTSMDNPADEKTRRLNERLVAADDLAKQHATVAEEAVSGWEKAKAESMSLKYQLDAAVEQKQAAEVRVFHLNGALKECMQQLRQAREEQEQSIHEAILKRSREWDRLRLDLEERLVDAEGQLAGLGNEKTLLCKKVQEQAEAVAELGRIRSEAEAEIIKLHVQVQALEKENTSLKYEIVVLNKELGIRNQEREMNKRALEMASQQHNESTKRTAKLEAECQRLRSLVRKKLPGPGALLQMKLEAGVDAERGDFVIKRRSSGRAATSPKVSHTDNPSVLSERLLAVEEETEMLKQTFAKKNKELQTARLLCGQTAEKPPSREGQAAMFQRSPRLSFMGPGIQVPHSYRSQEHGQVSSEDGNDDDVLSIADSWTSGITTEPAYSRKESPTFQQTNNNHAVKAIDKLNSIDDFLELERLVSLPCENKGVKPVVNVEQLPSNISDKVHAKDAELQVGNDISTDVSKHFAVGAEQLNLVCTKNTAELNLFSLQQKLLTILDSPHRRDTEMILEKVKKAVIDSRCRSVDGLQTLVMNISEDRASDRSNGMCSLQTSHLGEGSQVETWICKVIRVVEDLVSKGIADSRDCQASDHVTGQDIQPKPKFQLSELEASVKNFVAVANAYLYGKAELVQFMAELYSVLELLDSLLKAYKPFSGRMKWRLDAIQIAEQEVFSDVGSPFSLSSNSDRSDSLARKDSSVDERLASGKVQIEKLAAESRSRAEFNGVASLHHVIAELKQEKRELGNKLEEERGKLDVMKGQLLNSEQLVVTLRARLASAELSGIVADKSLSSVTAVKAQLELRLEDSQHELARLREKWKDLEILYDQEKRRNQELQTKSEEPRTLQRAIPGSLQEDAENSKKEQDIADATEKLAECQRTILVLGQQLKGIVLAQDGNSDTMYLNQVHENAAVAELLQHGNPMPTLQESKQRSPSHPEACGSSEFPTDTHTGLPKSIGPSLEEQAIELLDEKNPLCKDDGPMELHRVVNKHLIPFSPDRASKKKPNLCSFAATAMSKSLNLEPSTSPRMHAAGFRQFFSRHKSPS